PPAERTAGGSRMRILEVDHVAADTVRSFLDSLRQGRVDVDAAADLLGGEVPVLSQHQLVEQLGGIGANDVAAQQLTELSVGDDLGETIGLSQADSLAVRGE